MYISDYSFNYVFYKYKEEGEPEDPPEKPGGGDS